MSEREEMIEKQKLIERAIGAALGGWEDIKEISDDPETQTIRLTPGLWELKCIDEYIRYRPASAPFELDSAGDPLVAVDICLPGEKVFINVPQPLKWTFYIPPSSGGRGTLIKRTSQP